jgi:hypothetical protein
MRRCAGTTPTGSGQKVVAESLRIQRVLALTAYERKSEVVDASQVWRRLDGPRIANL